MITTLISIFLRTFLGLYAIDGLIIVTELQICVQSMVWRALHDILQITKPSTFSAFVEPVRQLRTIELYMVVLSVNMMVSLRI